MPISRDGDETTAECQDVLRTAQPALLIDAFTPYFDSKSFPKVCQCEWYGTAEKDSQHSAFQTRNVSEGATLASILSYVSLSP